MRGPIRNWAVGLAALGLVACKNKETKPAVISVAVSHVKPNGLEWDADQNGLDARPDIAMCVTYKDGRHCFSGDKPNVSDAVCKDSLSCQTKADLPPGGQVSVEVWDVDAQSDELIAKGQCAVGSACELNGCTVFIGPDGRELPQPKPGKVPECSKAPLDAPKIASLPTNPKAMTPINSRPGELITIYDYDVPACGGWMLALDNDEPVSWSLKCRRSCVEPASAGLGTLKQLVKDDTDAGAKATWYLVMDGPLKNAIVAFSPLPEGGNEVAVQSVQGIQDEPSYFIASWLCKNPTAVTGVNPAKCQ